MKVAVVGEGWYAVVVAKVLEKLGHEVLLVVKEVPNGTGTLKLAVLHDSATLVPDGYEAVVKVRDSLEALEVLEAVVRRA